VVAEKRTGNTMLTAAATPASRSGPTSTSRQRASRPGAEAEQGRRWCVSLDRARRGRV